MIRFAIWIYNTGYSVENRFYRDKLGVSESNYVTGEIIQMREGTSEELERIQKWCKSRKYLRESGRIR